MTDNEVQIACERRLRHYLTGELGELERMGMDHIPYAVKARQAIARIDEAADVSPPVARVGLRLVPPAA